MKNEKKIILITALTLTIFTICITGSAGAVDNFANGNFENGILSPWNVVTFSDYSGITAEISSSQAYEGIFSCYEKMYYQPAGSIRYAKAIYQDINMTGVLNISFRYKKSLSPAVNVLISMWQGGSFSTLITNFTHGVAATTSWQLGTITFTPGTYTGIKRISFRPEPGISTATYFDLFLDDIRVNGVPIVNIPDAEFNATQTYGASPFSVSFNDLSTKSPTSWYWDFGDGTSSTSRNPVHTYTSPGFYNVSFYASNSAGGNWENKTRYITVAEQLGSYYGYFYLTGEYIYENGYPTNGFNAALIENDPYDQYDTIVWYLDGNRVTDYDVSNFWVDHQELKNISGTWKTYNPSSGTWSTVTAPYQLLNKFHYHTNGNHIINAKIYYQNLTVADVSLSVTATDLGLLSSNWINVLSTRDNSMITGTLVNATDVMTGETSSKANPMGSNYFTLVKGHQYTVTATAAGYTTITQTITWPQTSSGTIELKMTPDDWLPSDTSKVYINAYVQNTGGQGINGALFQVRYTGSSTQTWPCDSSGHINIEVPKNTTVYWVASADYQGYATISGSVVVGTNNVPVTATLPVKTPTLQPTQMPTSQPVITAVPTLSGGGAFPALPQYDDTEREQIIGGSIDEWVTSLPDLVKLVIAVCFITLIGMMDSALTPGKRRK